MMRGLDKTSMAVRLPNGEIDVEKWDSGDLVHPKWYRKIPLVRGCVNMVESLIVGYKCLMKSAEKSIPDDEEEEEPSKFEQKIESIFGDKLFKIVGTIGTILGVVLALLLFMYVPMLIVKGISYLVPLGGWKTVIEGIIKIIIFILYLWGVSRLKDIRRTFEYHGAEHKSIACYEAGEELTVENIKKYRRFHPRCGTSFLLIVLVISILVFSVVTWNSMLIRILLKIALLPVVVGISYEIIRIAGRYDNIVTRIISAPGLWLQRLTTREPDASQIEVAIAALKEVLPEDRDVDRW
ncbi:MAG: DUF1385 domain-containing protein [Massilioclostridium sp.]|uniref:DUF1385 domain-containing protein n=2 Tax=Eubacteriales TaxID=186802 RepID=A0ABR7ITN9_9CLOT|nr:DUF1385 domain-containing protein [Clostridium facile]PWN00652.1 MAG: DUF1385 domain-containing protein [Massilioclostridium sp.]